MSNDNWQKVREIFDSAVRRKPEERQNYLVEVCGDDKTLFAEVESLLSSLDNVGNFMETPAVAKVAKVIEAETRKIETGRCFGHYEIIEQIGAGGMGEVYLAKDRKLDRQVAVKILNEKFSRDESNLQRFIQEAKAASALNHPNILTIYEFGEADDAHFIVSEFIKGKTLREILKDKTLSLSEILDISIQITNALCMAHEAHLIHRDIKPENVMIRPDGFIKVLDFGLAKLVERKNKSILGLEETTIGQNQTAKGVILGTVNYMSPEQAKGERVDECTDIFSLGVLIYEMLAGRTPFQGESVSETFANLINQEPPQLSRFTQNVPDELQRIVSKMLRKKKDERYQTMQDVFTDLKELKENLTLEAKLERTSDENATQVLQATTAQTFEAFSQSIKRHKPLMVLVLIGLLVGAIALGFYFFKAKNITVSNKKSIAVLPLKPINTASRDDIYEYGIADSLIIKLGSMKGFVVRPLSATRKYAEIEQDAIAAGREQQVDYVLASNYQLAGGKIKVTAELFNVASGQIEETYPIVKDAGNIFAMQDAIAGEVGNKLQTRFATASSGSPARRGTTNEEAYRLYLQGRNLTDTRNVGATRKAVDYFEQAIRLDPNFARAYAGMAHALILSGNLGGDLPRVEYEKARAAVNKALELDNNLAEGYAVLGELKYVYEWDFAGAEKDLLRAIELEPNSDLAHDQYALYLAVRGRFDEAIAESKTTQEIDPNSLKYQHINGLILFLARRYDEAILEFKRIIEVDGNFATAYGWLWLACEMKGGNAGAYEWFMKNQKRVNSPHLELYQKAYETAGWQGVRQKVLEFEKLNENKPGANFYRIARMCVLAGDKEQAFEYLNKAIEKRHGQLIMLNVEPTFDSLRDDPRFDELVRRIGLK